MRKNLVGAAFQLEADIKFREALQIWKKKTTFSRYPGAYVRAAEIARIQDNKKLLGKLISKIHPQAIFEEFGAQLGENLTIEWIRQRGRFNTNLEVIPENICRTMGSRW